MFTQLMQAYVQFLLRFILLLKEFHTQSHRAAQGKKKQSKSKHNYSVVFLEDINYDYSKLTEVFYFSYHFSGERGTVCENAAGRGGEIAPCH